ncbi:stress protein [Nakamurella silvestris]|nr:stress protein [Nakamurella silvestris]
MTDLARGANAPLAGTNLDIAVSGASQGTVDLLAFQLNEARQVRSDADLVFFNQPNSPEGAVQLIGPDRVRINLAGVPADVETLAIAVALDDSVSGSLSGVPGLGVTIADGGTGHSAPASGLTTERAALLVEVYRRQGAWKVRSVSAGWAEGLAGLVREMGVSVDETPAPPPAAPPTPPPAAAWPAPSAPPPAAWPAPSAPPPAAWPEPAAPPPAAWPAPSAPPAQQWPAPSAPPPAAWPAPAPAAAPAAPPRADGVRMVKGEEKLSLVKRQALDLRKKEVAKVLLTKGAGDLRARVLLVIDKTGSMSDEFQAGLVHRVVERMVPVAIQLDDDGSMECYMYAKSFFQLPDLQVGELEQWMATYIHMTGTHGGIDYRSIGFVNDEIPIMEEVISTLGRSTLPTLVLFFTDGGFSKKKQIINLMKDAAKLPAFWQFVGIGRNNFGVLEKLDEMSGRVVDNAGFFPVTDIDRVDDAELYRRLLSEFPDWIRAARAAGILR